MTPADAIARLRLARADGVGPVTYRRLLDRFGSAAAAVDALPRLARSGGGETPRVPSRSQAEAELDKVAGHGGRMVFLGTPTYPPLLAQLEDAPPALAVLGDPACLSAHCIGVVGSRNASSNGQRMAEDLANGLAAAGLVVVSGMARGIDAAAHRGAMQTGRTIAAVAGGLDMPYPREHARMQDQIAASGAVVAEAPFGTAPLARHFPRRNRIIAGLSLGVVLVEAALRSGSLITARIAGEEGRELFAVPGSPLDPRCRGCNDLIRRGAWLTEGVADVLERLRPGLAPAPAIQAPAPRVSVADSELGPARAKLVELLGPEPVAVDDLARRCQLSAAAVVAVLLELELAGRVETLPGNRVALIA